MEETLYFFKRSSTLHWAAFRCMRIVSSPLPEGLAVRICVLKAHLLQFTAAIQFIVTRVRLLSQVFHVHSDEHFSQFDEVTMIFILHCETDTHTTVTQGCFTQYIRWHPGWIR